MSDEWLLRYGFPVIVVAAMLGYGAIALWFRTWAPLPLCVLMLALLVKWYRNPYRSG